MTSPTTLHRLTKAELDALPLYAAVLCVDQKYRRVYLALKVGNPPGTGGHTWRTTDYTTIPDSGRLAADYAVLLDPGLTALVLMGFAQDATLARAAVKAEALTGTDQVANVVHARHAPDVVHSRHEAPRDIPSSENGPATTLALSRFAEVLHDALGEGRTPWAEEPEDLRRWWTKVTRNAVSRALRNPAAPLTLAKMLDPAAFADHPLEHRSPIAAVRWAARRQWATERAASLSAAILGTPS